MAHHGNTVDALVKSYWKPLRKPLQGATKPRLASLFSAIRNFSSKHE
jgi:hypothetical protein